MTTAYYPPTFRRQRIKVLRRKLIKVGMTKGVAHRHTLVLSRRLHELVVEVQREENK